MNEPIIEREDAPEHGPNFWTELTASMSDETTQMAPVTAGVAAAAEAPAAPTPIRSAGSRRMWPMAAAAAVLALVGFGALVSRGGTDPATEVVAGPTTIATASAAALDGPEDATGDDDEGAAGNGDGSDSGGTTSSDPNTSETNSTDPNSSETVSSGSESDAGTTGSATGDAESTALPEVTSVPAATVVATAAPAVVYDAAAGATEGIRYPPLDRGVPDTALFLATWPQRSLSWYAVTTPGLDCNDIGYAEIRYANDSGVTQTLRDPQIRFSGDISHFVVHPERDLAAWVVSCGQQLELYVATMSPTGQVLAPDLVWFGEGTVRSGLVTWQNNEVSLNAINPQGSPFWVDFDVASRIPTRNDLPSLVAREAGAPIELSMVPLAANADASRTYWSGEAPAGTLSACPENLGTNQASTLWLRSGEGQWQKAVTDDTLLGSVATMAIEPELGNVAFADQCADEVGRLFIGTLEANGSLGNLREIDLAPFVPGFASQVFWVDSQTLRIETDNSAYGIGTVRFDFRFDDGQDQGILVQLD